jgi:hypothetical protein
MSSVSQPFGLRPVYSPSGVVRPTAYSIQTGYAVNILQNQPVRNAPSTAGGETEGQVVAAAVGARYIGTFQGVEFTDSDGRRRVSNKWTASTAATEIVAYVTLDPSIVYEIQSDAALVVADIGKQYDFTTIGTGSQTVGISQMMLNVASAAANAQMRLIGITPGPDNNWGDTFVIAQVQISEHQNVADVAAY